MTRSQTKIARAGTTSPWAASAGLGALVVPALWLWEPGANSGIQRRIKARHPDLIWN